MSTAASRARRVPATTTSAERGAWRASLRFARRELVRTKGRTALMVTLVALPVAAMVFALVVIGSTTLSQREQAMVGLGSVADARFDVAPPSVAPSGATTVPLPFDDAPHADVTDWYFGRALVGGGYPYVHVAQGDLADPLLRGVYTLRAGAAAVAADDAVVSEALARARHVRVGDRVTLRRTKQTWTVSGVYRNATSLDELAIMAFRPPRGIDHADTVHRFVRATAAQLRALPESSHPSVTRARLASTMAFDDARSSTRRDLQVAAFTLGTIALAVLGVVISAAFAVSARRQLRSLGLVAANGGSPRAVRRALLAQGLVVGVAGAGMGGAIGGLGIAVIAPRLDRLANVVVPGLRFNGLGLAATACAAIGTALLSSAVPARAVARLSILQTLAARRAAGPLRRSIPVVGSVLLVAGVVGVSLMSLQHTSNALVIWGGYVGSVGALIVGAVMCAPAVVTLLDVVAGRRGGAARLAARTMTRNRARSGPIAGAIMVTLAIASAAATIGSTHERFGDHATAPASVVQVSVAPSGVEPPSGVLAVPDATIARVRTIVPDARSVQAFSPLGSGWSTVPPAEMWSPAPDETKDPTTTYLGVFSATAERAALVASGVPADAIAAWEQGSVLAFGPNYVRDGGVRFTQTDPNTGLVRAERLEPAVQLDRQLADPVSSAGARFCTAATACQEAPLDTMLLLPPRLVDQLHLSASRAIVQFVLAGPLTSSQREALRQAASDLRDESAAVAEAGADDLSPALVFADDPVRDPRLWLAFLTVAAMLLALGVTAIGLALGAAESRADDATMAALGAPPRLRRSLRAWEAAFTTCVGSVPGVVLGTIAGLTYAVTRSHRPGAGVLDVGLPWDVLASLAVAAPLAAAAVFWLGTGARRVTFVRED